MSAFNVSHLTSKFKIKKNDKICLSSIQYIVVNDLISFLRFTVTVAAGLPTEFKFNGRLEIGHDCQGKDDFAVQGRCISGEALIGVSANPAKQYIYGELSAVTLGKILRMLGSKLQLPPAVEQSGFPKGLTVRTRKSIQRQSTFISQQLKLC